MSTNKRTKSISRKINRSNFSGLLSAFIIIDILIILLPIFFWCSNIENSITDKTEAISSRRIITAGDIRNLTDITSSEYDTRNYNVYATAYQEYQKCEKTNADIFLPFNNGRKLLSETFYIIETDHKTVYCMYSGTFLLMLSSILFIIMLVEFLVLVWSVLFGARKIRYQLAPLDELAFKAEILGNSAYFDQQALDELEHAINEISPAKEGTHLHTGNSEMEHLERSINNLIDRMRESYRQQSRFVSDASHELRTPIAVLQGYVNMLDRWGKNDEKVLDESIEAIKSETAHMKKLVEQLLFLARGDSGKTKLNMENFSLNEMMKEVYEESLMIDKNHKYEFYPHNDDLTISGDISMLKQTARILIDNAAKYTPNEASITLKTSIHKSGSPAFIIQDEGIGIGNKDASHMFERFYRSDPARNKDSGGAGLGLSIAKWIIDKHNGYFEVLSREDIGTRITVILPLP